MSGVLPRWIHQTQAGSGAPQQEVTGMSDKRTLAMPEHCKTPLKKQEKKNLVLLNETEVRKLEVIKQGD